MKVVCFFDKFAKLLTSIGASMSYIAVCKFSLFIYSCVDSPVYSPEDGGNWMLAKMEIQRADITYEELVEHLTKTHFLMEPICVVMRSTMAIFHPLAQIFQWHCRGLLAINSMGLKKLLGEGEFLHKLFAIGSTGGLEVVNRAYHNTSWDDTDFWKKLQVSTLTSK